MMWLVYLVVVLLYAVAIYCIYLIFRESQR